VDIPARQAGIYLYYIANSIGDIEGLEKQKVRRLKSGIYSKNGGQHPAWAPELAKHHPEQPLRHPDQRGHGL